MNISVVGAGGHTRSSINLVKAKLDNSKIKIYDDSFRPNELEIVCEIPVVGTIDDVPEESKVFLSIGDNKRRAILYKRFQDHILEENLIHNSSVIEPNVDLGKSNQIFANTFINSVVKLGENNIINSGVLLEHEVQLGSHNHISIGSIIGGRTAIGSNCFIGAGAVLKDLISICDNVTVGAGGVVIKDITEPGTYVGNPVRKIKWSMFLAHV